MAAGALRGRRLQRHLRPGLDDGSYDCIASGTTVTPGRRKIADFCAPYAVSGQSLVVDVARHPNVRGIADLKGLVIGVQRGNTS
jgi:polar amino acid transport system substrate-binding protein